MYSEFKIVKGNRRRIIQCNILALSGNTGKKTKSALVGLVASGPKFEHKSF
jgi:hypothetical protein